MTIVPIKCPNCGAMVSRETMKCQYCGASLILAEDGSSLLSRKRVICPKCGSAMADGSWFCTACGEILTKDVDHLKQIQRKMRFQQESLKNDLPEIYDKIEPDEFIYFSFRFKGLLANKYFVVSDKKLIKYELHGQYWDAPWSEIVGIEGPRFESYGSWGYKNSLVVQTFSGPVTFDFGESNCLQFHRVTLQALNDYTLQRKDIRALICSLKFEDEKALTRLK